MLHECLIDGRGGAGKAKLATCRVQSFRYAYPGRLVLYPGRSPRKTAFVFGRADSSIFAERPAWTSLSSRFCGTGTFRGVQARTRIIILYKPCIRTVRYDYVRVRLTLTYTVKSENYLGNIAKF